MRFLPLVWAGLRRRRVRTLLTLLSITVAFLLFGLLAIIRESLTMGLAATGADRLITRHKVSIIQLLPVSHLARVAAVPGVEAVAAQTWFNGIYQEPRNFFPSMPVEPAAFLAMYPEFQLTPAAVQAWEATRHGAIVGRVTADRFGWQVGDRVPLHSPIWPRADGGAWEFEIVGIYEAGRKGTDTSQLFFRYDYFDEGRAEDMRGWIGWFTIRVSDPARAAELAQRVDAEFANSPAETKTEPEGAFVQGFAQQVGDVGAIVTGILGAVFFTILLVVGNTMAQSVRERTSELGVLKALGFSNRRVLALVLAESGLLAGVGAALGLGGAWLLSLGGSPAPGMLPVFYLPVPSLLAGAGLGLGLGLVTGAWPAWFATRLAIAEALRRDA